MTSNLFHGKRQSLKQVALAHTLQIQSFENHPEIHRRPAQWIPPNLFRPPLVEKWVAIHIQTYFWESLLGFPNIEEKYSHCPVTKYSENVNIFFGFYIVITDSLGNGNFLFNNNKKNPWSNYNWVYSFYHLWGLLMNTGLENLTLKWRFSS